MKFIEIPKGVRIPKSLRARLPTGRKFKDRTGEEISSRTVLGFVGYMSTSSAWLMKCKCGLMTIASSKTFCHSTFKSEKPHCCYPADTRVGFYPASRYYDNWLGVWHETKQEFLDRVLPAPSIGHGLACVGLELTEKTIVWLPLGETYRYKGHVFEVDGEVGNMAYWAKKAGISRERMRQRIESGNYSLYDSLTLSKMK